MVITTEFGDVRGIKKDGCTVYMAIPYAAPPVGDLAFRHPKEPAEWEGILSAEQGSCNPIQAQGMFGVNNNSQDCLYMNIFVPETKAEKLPVMVFLYGGAYTQGGAGAQEDGKLCYDMRLFAIETNTIVVTFNYRLNLYGFLNLSFLDERFERNNGLYDQIMAIRFVNRNIEAFGGDKNNVTIFGQSAGGACILALMTMREPEGLFQKAIVQSACVDHFFTEEESQKNTKAYMKLVGVTRPEQLYSLSAEAVMAANKRYAASFRKKGELRCPFSPVVDGVTLKKEPKKAVVNSEIPLLIGHNSQEGNLFIRNVPTAILPFAAMLYHLRPENNKPPYRERFSNAITKRVYGDPEQEIVNHYTGEVWQYIFAHTLPNCTMGCCHASELSFLFGETKTIDGVNIPDDDHTGSDLRRIWADFAKYGNPGWESHNLSQMGKIIS